MRSVDADLLRVLCIISHCDSTHTNFTTGHGIGVTYIDSMFLLPPLSLPRFCWLSSLVWWSFTMALGLPVASVATCNALCILVGSVGVPWNMVMRTVSTLCFGCVPLQQHRPVVVLVGLLFAMFHSIHRCSVAKGGVRLKVFDVLVQHDVCVVARKSSVIFVSSSALNFSFNFCMHFTCLLLPLNMLFMTVCLVSAALGHHVDVISSLTAGYTMLNAHFSQAEVTSFL